MNGVRRLLGAASSPPSPAQHIDPSTPQSSVLPLFSAKPSSGAPNWPPASPAQPHTPISESPKSTAALFFKKDRPKPPPVPEDINYSDPANRSWHSNRSSAASSHGPNYTSRPQFSSPTHSPQHNNIISTDNSPSSRSSSPRRAPVNRPDRILSRKSTGQSAESEWNQKRSSGPLNTRDELLMSLMSSEAVVDSREYEILSTEEVEELKKEHAILSSRLVAMTKKVNLETKIRDAALSLSRVNASHNKVSKQTDDQLAAANARVENAQKELWRVSERANEIHKRLLEHRAGVLSFSVRNMEKKISQPSTLSMSGMDGEDSGYDTSNRSTLMSPATGISSASFSSSVAKQSKFDGAHLFAGHADAIVPKRKLPPESASREIASLEERLKAATSSLATSSKIQAEMTRELTHLRLEKQEVETLMGMELQNAEETIEALEKEMPRLEGLDSEVKALKKEKVTWEDQRTRLEKDARGVEVLRDRVQELEMRTVEATGGAEKMLADLREGHRRELADRGLALQRMREDWDKERTAWDLERVEMEDEKMDDLARLHDEMDRLREVDEQVLQQANKELNNTLGTLRGIVNQFNIPQAKRDSNGSAMQNLLDAVRDHLDVAHTRIERFGRAEGEWDSVKRQMDADLKKAYDKQEMLAKELEETKRERDLVRRNTTSSSSRSLSSSPETKFKPELARSPPTPASSLSSFPALPTSTEYGPDLEGGKFIAALQPLWAILPSPEARAAKFSSSNSRSYRTGSPTSTPSSPSGNNNGGSVNTNGVVSSLSDLDVRSLKSLYDPRQHASPSTPSSPKPNGLHALSGPSNNGPFTLESFISRVHALIADDRALIERLVRFAQAHDLLKKNAERAQKLAQDGNSALETYQRQVRILEERNASMGARVAAVQDELQLLHEAIERTTAEKHQVEALAAEQAETCRQLTEANNTLSARALTLAEEAASAPEMVRKQLEDCRRQLDGSKKQLEDAKKTATERADELERAQDEIEAMRSAEQGQRIALLDELNSMQTENGNLRMQLRAAKSGK